MVAGRLRQLTQMREDEKIQTDRAVEAINVAAEYPWPRSGLLEQPAAADRPLRGPALNRSIKPLLLVPKRVVL